MDNNAFKDLVRSKVKSTKQIAREAVEEAFAQKKKKGGRKRGRGGGDQDDLDSSESESEGRGNKKKGKKKDDEYVDDDADMLMQPSSVKGAPKTKKESRYRDRAKERREGKNADYQDSQKLLETVSNKAKKEGEDEEGQESTLDATELSKYLGGDEAHTHLVKGLDLSLAESVRREMKNEEDNPVLDEDEEEDKPVLDESLQPINTKEEAIAYVKQQQQQQQQSSTTTIRSALGRSMLQYHHRQLQSIADMHNLVKVSGAGAAVQRTQLVFAIDWNPQNLAKSWEVPSERSHAATSVSQQHSGVPKASPLSRELIQQIIDKQQERAAKLNTVVPASVAAVKEAPMDDSSDDDIFPDAGDD